MRKLIIFLILALAALGVSYKLGYLDNSIKRYILKEKLAESNISTTPANASITVHDTVIQTISAEGSSAILTLTLKNTTNKTHELIRIETEISNDVSFFEPFHKNGQREIIQVFGIPVEGFSIITLTPQNSFAKINNINNLPKKGDSISVQLIFSDDSKKNIVATVK